MLLRFLLTTLLISTTTVMSTTPKRVAIITGGTRGIGRGITQALAESGECDAFLLSYNTNKEAAETFVSELCSKYDSLQIELVGGDISLSSTRDEIFACFDDKFGEECCLAVVVHNAGQYVGITSDNADGLESNPQLAFGDGSMLADDRVDFTMMQYYQRMYGEAYVDLCERALVRMKQAADKHVNYRGTLIGISSPGCNAVQRPTLGYDMPGSGKCVMEYAMRLFALRAAPFGVNCNIVIPGATKSEGWSRMEKKRGVAEGQLFNSMVNQAVPMKKALDPMDIGNAIVFLSNHGRYITGVSLPVDGGFHLRAGSGVSPAKRK